MTPLTAELRAEIAAYGPISFDRFMERALYDPEHGYYRGARTVFGREGDFYTAEQLQPVFGILMRQAVQQLWREMGEPAAFQVVELGAGRGEMAAAFAEFNYVPVEWGGAAMPDRLRGVIFANEFFDALPVRVFRWTSGAYRELLVACEGERFVWTEGGEPDEANARYLNAYVQPQDDDVLVETCLPALDWLKRIAKTLDSGYVIAIDYGYTRRELVRFPQGTLMAYRRHAASDDVLADPGAIDITAHVNFTALLEHASLLGLECIRWETLARTLLRAGEPDQFAAALQADTMVEQTRRRLQLKLLLFGMGETFRTLLLKAGPK